MVLEVTRSPSCSTSRAEADSERLTKGERRLMHTLMDMEEDDRLDYEPKPTEQIVEKLMKLGFIEVKVTAKGRAFMNEG
jgi:hypothetical protein